MDTAKNVWSCFRCASGGSGLELVALKHHIIECHEARPGCLRGDRFWDAVDAAIEDGFEIPDEIIEKYLAGSGIITLLQRSLKKGTNRIRFLMIFLGTR